MNKKIKTLIVGAGSAGRTIVRELLSSSSVYDTPVCMVDDDINKLNTCFHRVPVLGNINDIPELAKKLNIEEILICMPSVDRSRINEIYSICEKTDCNIKILPGIYQFINEKKYLSRMRNVEISDLLGREQKAVLDDNTISYYKDKTILITGGGGSIGSELCRQIAKMSPKQLIILDIYENCAYEIEQELKFKYGSSFDLKVEIASITNRPALERVFKKYQPNIVIMAAAHKHVPLMEHNVIEAIENNVFGTLNTIELAELYHADRVHLVSTDKAVNPTSIMGASKRICEMLIQYHAKNKQHTTFSLTRFGNVLGSAGSVIPLFKKQIAEGGPITLTDKRIIRYFMTIPEAAQLVLTSASMANNGELFVLDMGEPVKIYDLAVNMIKLSGYQVNKDIKIIETGLRPGEKLYEELLINTERLEKTDNKLIFIEKDASLPSLTLSQILNKLKDGIQSNDDDEMRKAIIEVVPTFIYQQIDNVTK